LIKLQINLYEHREIDNKIIQILGLDKSSNPNALVKDLLYKMASGETMQTIAPTIKEETIQHIEPKEVDETPIKINSRLLNSLQSLL